MGEVLLAARQYNDSEQAMRAAARQISDSLGQKHPRYARALEQLSRLYVARNDPRAAREAAEEALTVVEAALGKRHPEYADALSQLAAVHRLLNEPDRAAALQREAERILAAALQEGERQAVRQLESQLDSLHR